MENNMLVENWIPPSPHAPGCKFLVQGGHSQCVRCLENENSALRDALGSLRDFVEGERHDCESIAEILNGVSVGEHVSETYRLEGELLKAVAAVEYWIKVASDHGADIVSLSNDQGQLRRENDHE